ncbi:hypothetical protein ABIB73_000112 [Bradyrhizobium sp. F1.4.3]|uniref:hypothetical protein n=1 Tax=Bradyrhizobium sp. F1.4.3 TaxID=3156356 RepID=UPI00339433FF
MSHWYPSGKTERQVKDRKDRSERFRDMVAFVTDRGGWVTSSPGASEITIDCLPSSTLPTELAKAGHKIEQIGDGERIIPGTIVENFTTGLDGELVPLPEGSTEPVTMTLRHTGIIAVKRYALPPLGDVQQ